MPRNAIWSNIATAGGRDLNLPAAPLHAAEKRQTIAIPGPLRSFARMAALAPETAPDEVLPALARNIVTNGYQAASSNEALEQTEYLKLVIRYLSQARELEKLADSSGIIKIETCDSSQTGELLRVLGYRMRGGCGSEVVLETVNATRAFLTIDSGFPLAELEQDLRTNRPFAYDYKPTQVPMLYAQDYWLSAKDREGAEFIDAFLGDPSLCRLYLALSKLDPAASEELRKSTTVQRIRAYAHVLDFYGGMFQIRNGQAVVPGGARSEKAWADLVGARPKSRRVLRATDVRDDGWLASYFDALSRITNNPSQRAGSELSDRSGSPEAILSGHSRQGDQPRSGPPGVPLEHRHDAADHAPAPGFERQAAHSGRPGSMAELCSLNIRRQRQIRHQAQQGRSQLEGSRRRDRSAVRRSAANRSRTSR